MSDHTITWTHEGSDLVGKIVCTAAQTAWCRQTCPEGCENWTPDHEHGLVDYGACQAIEDFDAHGIDLWERYEGTDEVLARSAPVIVAWNSDGYWAWWYADDAANFGQPAASAEPSAAAVDAAARVLWNFAATTSLAYPWDVVPDDVRERVSSHAADILRAGAGL